MAGRKGLPGVLFWLIAPMLLALAGASAQAALPPPVALLELTQDDPERHEARILTQRLQEELEGSRFWNMLPRTKVTAAQAAIGEGVVRPCFQAGCAARIGLAAGAEWVVAGRLESAAGQDWTLRLLVVRVDTAALERSETLLIMGGYRALTGAGVIRAVELLLGRSGGAVALEDEEILPPVKMHARSLIQAGYGWGETSLTAFPGTADSRDLLEEYLSWHGLWVSHERVLEKRMGLGMDLAFRLELGGGLITSVDQYEYTGETGYRLDGPGDPEGTYTAAGASLMFWSNVFSAAEELSTALEVGLSWWKGRYRMQDALFAASGSESWDLVLKMFHLGVMLDFENSGPAGGVSRNAGFFFRLGLPLALEGSRISEYSRRGISPGGGYHKTGLYLGLGF